MNCNEFISLMKSHGAKFAPAASMPSITLANTTLQNIRAAMLPKSITDLYMQCSALNLGNGYIFGPTEIKRGNKYPIPSIIDINPKLSGCPSLLGKTVFGRNDLFWFAFDSFGTYFMLDNVTLKQLRKYEDPYKAMSDCLIAGNI